MNSQGYAVIRLVWPPQRESIYIRRRGNIDTTKKNSSYRRLVRLCKYLHKSMDYRVTYYLTIPIPVAVVEWPGRWMKPRQRAVKISTWVGRYPSLPSKGMASYEIMDSWEGQ